MLQLPIYLHVCRCIWYLHPFFTANVLSMYQISFCIEDAYYHGETNCAHNYSPTLPLLWNGFVILFGQYTLKTFRKKMINLLLTLKLFVDIYYSEKRTGEQRVIDPLKVFVLLFLFWLHKFHFHIVWKIEIKNYIGSDTRLQVGNSMTFTLLSELFECTFDHEKEYYEYDVHTCTCTLHKRITHVKT